MDLGYGVAMTTRLTPTTVMALTLACVAAGPLSAQSDYRLAVNEGTEVRVAVRGSGGTVHGRTERVAGDTLLLRASGNAVTRRFLLHDLERLELRGGKDHRRGVTIGATVGGVVTLVFGGIDVSRNSTALPEDQISAAEVVAAAALNAAIGGIIGYALAPGGWERLPLPRR